MSATTPFIFAHFWWPFHFSAAAAAAAFFCLRAEGLPGGQTSVGAHHPCMTLNFTRCIIMSLAYQHQFSLTLHVTISFQLNFSHMNTLKQQRERDSERESMVERPPATAKAYRQALR